MQNITQERAKEILKHLEKTGQGFCFVDGVIVDKMSAELIASGGEAE